MGHRTNFVVMEEKGWRLHFSHWAANGIAGHLAAGPDAAVRFVDAQLRCDPETGWMDDKWAEGGALIDLPGRRLLFYGDDQLIELEYKRAFLALLAETWPGWRVEWAIDGIGDLAAAVGVRREVVRNLDEPEVLWATPIGDLAGAALMLLSVRHGDGHLTAHVLEGDDHLAWAGAAMVDALPPASAPPVDLAQIPVLGLHIEIGPQRVGWWTADIAPGLTERAAELWPGWQVECWGDRYEEQVARCDDAVRVAAPDLGAALDRVAATLERHRSHDPLGRMEEMLTLMVSQGPPDTRAEVNPLITAHEHAPPDDQAWARVVAGLAAVRRRLTT